MECLVRLTKKPNPNTSVIQSLLHLNCTSLCSFASCKHYMLYLSYYLNDLYLLEYFLPIYTRVLFMEIRGSFNDLFTLALDY